MRALLHKRCTLERLQMPREKHSPIPFFTVEPVVGIEPTTDGLQNRCSTTELHWR